jgi:pimeloyl-ACP methyl ester carboxylesterase
MTNHRARYGPHNPDATYVDHGLKEQTADVGEVQINYATADPQSNRVRELLTGAGVDVSYRSFPDVGHSMHGENPELYVETLCDWVAGLDF